MSDPLDAIVVGGGIAGLTAAFHLHRAGLSPRLFEASGRAGGALRTEVRDGYRAELGPNTVLPRPEALARLIVDLKLTPIPADAASARRFIVRGGELHALPSHPLGVLRSPLLSRRARLRLLREPFARSTDASAETVSSFVRRRLGPEALDFAVEPFVAGTYAGDPDQLSLRHALPELLRMEREHGSIFRGLLARPRGGPRPMPFSFEAGLEQLPEALCASLGTRVHLQHEVIRVASEEGGFSVTVRHRGETQSLRTRRLVLALPAPALTGLVPYLGALAEVPHPPVSILALGFDRRQVRHPLDGFGMLIPRREPFRTLGTLFSSTLFPDRAPKGHVLLTSFLGGARHPNDAMLPEHDQITLVLRELSALLGVTGQPDFIASRTWTHAIPQYTPEHDETLSALDRLEAEWPGCVTAGSLRNGVSVGAVVADAEQTVMRLLAEQAHST